MRTPNSKEEKLSSKSMSLRLSKDLADKVQQKAKTQNQTVNAFITKTLSEHLEMEGLPEAIRESNRITLAKATMDLMLGWNEMIKPYQDDIRHLLGKNRREERENFEENAPRIVVAPNAEEELTAKAVKGMLNFFEGICYGILFGALDRKAEDAFPIEFFTFELLFPIQVCYSLIEEGKTGHGWPKIEQYLREKKGNDIFDQKFEMYRKRYKKSDYFTKNENPAE